MNYSRRLSKWVIAIAFLVTGLGVASVIGWKFVNSRYNGRSLAKMIEDGFNKNRRGRIEIDDVHWRPSAVFDFISGRSTQVSIKGLRMFDSRGILTVSVPTAKGRIFIEPLRKNVSLVLRDIKASSGFLRVEMFEKPDEKGSWEIGILGLIKSKPSKTNDKSIESSDLPDKSWEVSFKGADVSGLDVVVDLPGLDLNIKDISLKGGSLLFRTESKEGPMRFGLQGKPSASSVKGTLLGTDINFTDVKFLSGYMDPSEPFNLHFTLEAKESGSPLKASAFLGDHGITVDLAAKDIASIATRFSRIFKFEEGNGGSQGSVHIRGTLREPEIHVSGGGIRMKSPTGDYITDISSEILITKRFYSTVMEFAEIKGTLKNTPISVNGAWDLSGGNLFVKVASKNLKLQDFYAEAADLGIPSELQGDFSVRLVFPRVNSILYGWEVAFEPSKLFGLTYSGGSFVIEDSKIKLRKAWLKNDELRLDSSGEIDENRNMNLAVALKTYDMQQVLKHYKVNAAFRSMDFNGKVSGHLSNPKAGGKIAVKSASFSGVNVPYVNGFISFNRYGLDIEKLSAGFSGGSIGGKVGVSWKTGLWSNVFLTLNNLNMDYLTKGLVKSRVSGNVKASGYGTNLNGNVKLETGNGSIKGIRYSSSIAEIKIKNGDGIIKTGKIIFPESKLIFGGTISRNLNMQLSLLVDSFRLDREPNSPVKGTVNADLKFAGSFGNPMVSGSVSWNNPEIFGNRHSNGNLKFSSKDGINSFEGSFFDLLALKGKFNLASSINANASIKFTDINPSFFMPAGVLANLGVSVVTSGMGQLQVGKDLNPTGTITVSRLDIGLTGRKHAWLPAKPEKKLKLEDNIRIEYYQKEVRLRRFKISGENTALAVYGRYKEGAGGLRIKGDIGTSLFAYLAPAGFIETATGAVLLDANLKLKKGLPDVNGSVYFAGNTFSLNNMEGSFTVQSGVVSFAKDKVLINKLRIVYNEEEVVVNGYTLLDADMKPTSVNLQINGYLSSRIASILMPGSLYSTTGRSTVAITVTGDIRKPIIRGKIDIIENNRIVFRTGREIQLAKGGLIHFEGKDINFTRLKVMVEDGYAELNGRFSWENARPVDADIDIKLRNFTERTSSYEVEAMGDLHIGSIGSGPMTLEGTIDLLNARYTKKYNVNLVDKLLTPVSRTSESSGGSLLDRITWLKDMRLNITIQLTGDIEIDNNFAQTRLEGVVNLLGTLASPRFGGIVALNGGNFRIPMLRGTYEIKEGLIDFDKAKNTGHSKDEPFIDVLGEMNFTDRSENEHLISLKLEGFVSQLKLNWSSSTGLNSAQVLTLLMLNRTPDEIRKGESGGLPDVGGLLEGYVPLNLQLGLTSDRVKVYVEKKFMSDHVVLKGNVDFGFMGQQRQDANLIFRIHDNIQVEGKATRKTADEESALPQDETELQGRVELKYKLKIKGNWKDILGI
ncbi:translocation/assembly module TamB domain-containing protein [Myxococcota bacterium]|nr:translocation/assembly module TamB domain-containing protein [Myxococcota bacterium]MBU1381494.1 translocation/assembly module TamB domain-containing protein [Myxococcota bacterium]MBU1497672.1 translocation/assembly module TamB domain-containing protein [Myxococcota bacterium]